MEPREDTLARLHCQGTDHTIAYRKVQAKAPSGSDFEPDGPAERQRKPKDARTAQSATISPGVAFLRAVSDQAQRGCAQECLECLESPECPSALVKVAK